MTNELIDTIELILDRLKKAYPQYEDISADCFFGNDPTQEQESLCEEARAIVVAQGLGHESPKDDLLLKLLPFGIEVMREGGFKAYLHRKAEEQKVRERMKRMEFEKLEGELKKIRRDNRYWRLAALAGAVAFLLEVFDKVWPLVR